RHTLAGLSDAVDHLPGARALDHVQGYDTPGLLAALGNERAPGTDLFHVLQADDPGLGDAGPLDHHPRQVANLLLAWLATGRLAVVRAIRAGVKPANLAACKRLNRIHCPDVSLQVQRA